MVSVLFMTPTPRMPRLLASRTFMRLHRGGILAAYVAVVVKDWAAIIASSTAKKKIEGLQMGGRLIRKAYSFDYDSVRS